LTEFGQKGSGEAGYLGSPAAIANAINDALAPMKARISALPMTPQAIWQALEEAKAQTSASSSPQAQTQTHA
jgi:2-furoyl-CoA dehydrogenase large subunit